MILKRIEPALVLHTFFFATISLVLLASVSSPEIQFRQLISAGIGIGVYLVAAFAGKDFWASLAPWFFICSLLLLSGVLIAGDSAGGATRWFSIAGARFQPSEFTKIAVILTLGLFANRLPRNFAGFGFKDLILPSLIIAAPSILILLQPDLGTAGCHILVGASILLALGVRKRTFISLMILGALAAYPIWTSLHSYQQDRILTFISPDADPLGEGYHQRQSLIAVGSGKLFGKGFGSGTQTQLRFLPEQNTDFIFSVLAEEWGFAGSLVLIFGYCSILYVLLSGAKDQKDKFSGVVRVGAASLLFWQAVINIGMATGVAPVVGLTLPLVSFGGSSFVSIMLLLGICAACRQK